MAINLLIHMYTHEYAGALNPRLAFKILSMEYRTGCDKKRKKKKPRENYGLKYITSEPQNTSSSRLSVVIITNAPEFTNLETDLCLVPTNYHQPVSSGSTCCSLWAHMFFAASSQNIYVQMYMHYFFFFLVYFFPHLLHQRCFTAPYFSRHLC